MQHHRRRGSRHTTVPATRAIMGRMILVLRLIVTAFAIWLAASWVDGISIASSGRGQGWDLAVLIGIAAVFTVINALVKPIVQLLSLPLIVLTLGLFLLVINALMLLLTAAITESTGYGLTVDGFGAAFWGAVIVSVVNWVLGGLVPDRRSARR
ncbi:putative membrane protein [Rhodococcus sp. PvP016]|uniref:Membrane protein n=2 Tax=Mycobacteriales TaxID=85007 RepID=A0ABS2KW50_9NOCA|nr:putative membrane protein [Rhodococcus corynebacterioides]MBP1114422.1 putative membrane protein [Rhodococcus sp. PvP016]